MIRIQTGRRIHFGLFAPVPIPELDLAYGGLGMMVDAPGVVLEGKLDNEWSVQGMEKERAEQMLSTLQREIPSLRPMQINVSYIAPTHQGWGTGTQIALALARLVSVASQQDISVTETARLLGRGQRSGIGIAGFEMGGLLLDHGITSSEAVGSTVQSYLLPPKWTLVLVEPGQEQGLHADEERQAFKQLQDIDRETVKQLRSVASEVLVPAASQADFATFADNLTLYNRLAGSLFRTVQHGDYSTPQTEQRLEAMREEGAIGRGQSSWGPGLFALFPTLMEAETFRKQCTLPGCRMMLAKPQTTGASIIQPNEELYY